MSWFSEFLNGPARERKAAMAAAKEQMDFYRNEKEALSKQRAEIENEKTVAKQRIAEKQLRARKALYRRAGFLETPNTSPTEQLG